MKSILCDHLINLDLHLVFKYRYFSKSESEYFQTLSQICSEKSSLNVNAREAMHELAISYSTLRQVSFQKAVYYILLQLCKNNFVSAGTPSELIRISKLVEETKQSGPIVQALFDKHDR